MLASSLGLCWGSRQESSAPIFYLQNPATRPRKRVKRYRRLQLSSRRPSTSCYIKPIKDWKAGMEGPQQGRRWIDFPSAEQGNLIYSNGFFYIKISSEPLPGAQCSSPPLAPLSCCPSPGLIECPSLEGGGVPPTTDLS